MCVCENRIRHELQPLRYLYKLPGISAYNSHWGDGILPPLPRARPAPLRAPAPAPVLRPRHRVPPRQRRGAPPSGTPGALASGPFTPVSPPTVSARVVAPPSPCVVSPPASSIVSPPMAPIPATASIVSLSAAVPLSFSPAAAVSPRTAIVSALPAVGPSALSPPVGVPLPGPPYAGGGGGDDDVGGDAASPSASALLLVHLLLGLAVNAARVRRGVRPRARPVLPLPGTKASTQGGAHVARFLRSISTRRKVVVDDASPCRAFFFSFERQSPSQTSGTKKTRLCAPSPYLDSFCPAAAASVPSPPGTPLPLETSSPPGAASRSAKDRAPPLPLRLLAPLLPPRPAASRAACFSAFF